jgi:hypothetical protein
VITALTQKKITALADIRNSAAHGQVGCFRTVRRRSNDQLDSRFYATEFLISKVSAMSRPSAAPRCRPRPSPLLVRMHPLVGRDLARLRQLDHVHRWRIASPFGELESDKDMLSEPPAWGWGCRLEAAHSVPPEIRTCDRRPAKLTQSCRPFRTSSDYPFGVLRGTERSDRRRIIGSCSDCIPPPASPGRRWRHWAIVGDGCAALHIAFHPQRPEAVGLRAIGLTGGFLCVFPGLPRAYVGAHDLAAPDDLSRFGAHGWRLQRHGPGLAIHDR